jgi:uncharacterized protein YaaN involved in tellurite resistance
LYKKKKEIETVVKQLKREADQLVEQIQQLEQVAEVAKIKKEVMDFWHAIRMTFTNDPNLQKVDMFFDKLNELLDKVNRLEAMVAPYMEKVKGKKAKKEVYEQAYQHERVL